MQQKNPKKNLPPTQTLSLKTLTHQGLHQPLYSSTTLCYVTSGYLTSYFIACLLLWCWLSDAVSACCSVGSWGRKCQVGSMLTIKLTLTFDFENLKTAKKWQKENKGDIQPFSNIFFIILHSWFWVCLESTTSLSMSLCTFLPWQSDLVLDYAVEVIVGEKLHQKNLLLEKVC